MNKKSHNSPATTTTRTSLLLLAVGLVVLALGLFAAACGGGGTTTTTIATGTTATTTVASTETTGTTQPLPATLKIGAVIPLTGANAGLGAQVKGGYELAVKDINDAGGVSVGGTKIKLDLTILDDESDPTKTVQQLETEASNGVLAYLGGAGSNLHAAAAAIAEKNKIPYLGVAFAQYTGVLDKGFKYVFSPFPKSADHAKATFDLLDSLSPKPTKIAVFAEKTDWGAEMVKDWQAEADKRGGYTITVYQYAPGTTDYSSLIQPAKTSGAEVLLALPLPPDGLAMMKQIKELDWNAKLYLLIRAADPPTFGKNLGVDSDGVLLLPGWNPGLTYPGVKELVAEYQTVNNAPAVALTGPAYACVQILADAISRAKTLDRDGIRDAIAATNLDTVVGPGIQFNPDGTSNAPDPINQWQGGKQVLVFPADVALGKVIYPATPWKERQ